jgi:hypothetical protein
MVAPHRGPWCWPFSCRLAPLVAIMKQSLVHRGPTQPCWCLVVGPPFLSQPEALLPHIQAAAVESKPRGWHEASASGGRSRKLALSTLADSCVCSTHCAKNSLLFLSCGCGAVSGETVLCQRARPCLHKVQVTPFHQSTASRHTFYSAPRFYRQQTSCCESCVCRTEGGGDE